LELHAGPDELVTANAWDVVSAVVIQNLGFQALATTSAGIAFGRADPGAQTIGREALAHAATDKLMGGL